MYLKKSFIGVSIRVGQGMKEKLQIGQKKFKRKSEFKDIHRQRARAHTVHKALKHPTHRKV